MPDIGDQTVVVREPGGHKHEDDVEDDIHQYVFAWADDGGARTNQTIWARTQAEAEATAQLWLDRTKDPDGTGVPRGVHKTARLIFQPAKVPKPKRDR